MRFLIFAIFYVTVFQLGAQETITATTGEQRLKSESKKNSTWLKSPFRHYEVKNVGPTVFSGRVVDVDVNPDNPAEFYVAYASGGLWYTNNNGTTFEPKFDKEAVITIGDIAVNWNNGDIWIGTGEVNSSRSSYAGIGMYYSNDGGENWQYKGLEESHHIGRVLIDQNDTDIIYVAVLGHLYSENEERGIYKTANKGKTWEKVLFVNDNTGGIDLIQNPKEPGILYAAMWERSRKAWNFVESGNGSGIYRSKDYGETWKLITGKLSGFPNDENTGRIGLSLSFIENEPVLYALLDNQNRRPEKEKEEGLSKGQLRDMSKAEFLTIDTNQLETYLRDNGFPKKYTAQSIFEDISNDKYAVIDLVEYLEDANSLLFDTPVIGAEVYVYNEGIFEWTRTTKEYFDGLYNSYGYYFGQIKSEKNNPEVIYIMGVPILKSIDGGQTWKSVNGENVHVDHHALWINQENPNHIINGNDGGINISYDKGETWIKCNSPEVGQFYTVNVDDQEPYNIYGGTQDNGVWKGNHDYKKGVRWQMTGDYPYDMIMGGDGMQIQIDNRDNTTYTGFQFGHYFKISEDDRTYITPKHELGERPYRWNWQSPILLSSHNQDIVYMGANKLLRSMDRGKNFTAISPDLTGGGRKGDVAYGTLTSISESKLKFGLIYTGSDDGLVFRTKDGGVTWENIGNGLPENMWVSRVVASEHNDSTVYISLNGYRWDNWEAMLFKSTDFGNSWTSLSHSLPMECINVVKEDPKDSKILYVGTDHGLYVSLDNGNNFYPFAEDLPRVAIHDLAVQNREDHLVIATHGRSIYIADIKPLRNLSMNESIELLDFPEIRYSQNWGTRRNIYSDYLKPEYEVVLYSNVEKSVTCRIESMDGRLLHKYDLNFKRGICTYPLELFVTDNVKHYEKKYLNKEILEPQDDGKRYLRKGEYLFKISNSDAKIEKTFLID